MENLNSRSLNNSSLNIGIIGLGAIGCLLSSQIPQCFNVFALPSNPNDLNVNFQIDENDQSNHYSIPVWQDEILDIIIICCKATQCLSALDLWQDAINDQSQIVLLQNGMGQHQIVASNLPNNTIFAASTTEGAFKKEAHHVVHAGKGITHWGYYSGPSEASKATLKLDVSQLKGQHKWHKTIEEVLLAKLALNSIINPLTVKYDCHNGDLINNPEMLQELEDLCKETAVFFTEMQWTLDFDLTERVKSIAKLTAKNRSSMLQDIQAQRKTEIDYINGYLLNKANEINHHLPSHQQLFNYIKSLQRI
ncbi:MAG: 2-dehydropantoate 2-reductase [Oleispira sp.]|jgi:2-dehydropantoate 2-reductase